MFLKESMPTYYQTCNNLTPKASVKPFASYSVNNFLDCAIKCGDFVCNTFSFNSENKQCYLYSNKYTCSVFIQDSQFTTGFFNKAFNTGTRVYNEVTLKICNAVGFGPNTAFCYPSSANVALADFDGCHAVNILGANLFQPTFPSWFEFLWTNYGVLIPRIVERDLIDHISPARTQYRYDTGT